LLINLQPYARPINIEVRVGGESRQAGIARDIAEKLVAMKASLRVVAKLVGSGLYSLREEAEWQFEMQYHSAADWQEFLDRPTCGGADVDQKLFDATFAQQDGYVVSTEDDLAQSYERLD
jgi:hypothetical protein